MLSCYWLLLFLSAGLWAGCSSPVVVDESLPLPADSIAVSPFPAHLDTALVYIGVTDRGDNTGVEVDRFLASVGLDPGYAWCAAFVSYCLDSTKVTVTSPTVRSALARDFKVPGSYIDARIVSRGLEVPAGTIVGWQRGNGPYGHLGFTRKNWSGPCGFTVEGNTSPPNSGGSEFNGGGVWEKERCIVASNHFRITWFLEVDYDI